MKKYKILIITTSYSEKSTGQEAAGSFVNTFVEDLKAEQNIAVRVIYPSISGTPTHCHEKPFYVKFLPLSLLKITNIFNWKHIFNTIFAGRAAAIKISEEFNPDYVLAMWALPSGYWARVVAKKHGIPYSNWCLGSDIWSLSKIPVVKSILKRVIKGARYNFADGYKLCNDVTQLSKKECIFLPSSRQLNFQDANPLLKKGKFNLCFIGRWHENKGIDILLDSLSILLNKDKKLINCITISGGGPLDKLVKNKVKKLVESGLPIRLNSYVSKEEAESLIQESDFVLIPSRIESIPIIFSDAIQMLRPVIAMPVGDLPYLINKYKCGVLATTISPESFSDAITKALKLDVELIENNLEITRKDFFINQMNYLKFLDVIIKND